MGAAGAAECGEGDSDWSGHREADYAFHRERQEGEAQQSCGKARDDDAPRQRPRPMYPVNHSGYQPHRKGQSDK